MKCRELNAAAKNGKFALAVVLALLGTPAPAFADGFLSLHSDAALTECLLSDEVPGVKNVYLSDQGTSLNVNCSDCAPVAVEPTTWGKVKSLYRN